MPLAPSPINLGHTSSRGPVVASATGTSPVTSLGLCRSRVPRRRASCRARCRPRIGCARCPRRPLRFASSPAGRRVLPGPRFGAVEPARRQGRCTGRARSGRRPCRRTASQGTRSDSDRGRGGRTGRHHVSGPLSAASRSTTQCPGCERSDRALRTGTTDLESLGQPSALWLAITRWRKASQSGCALSAASALHKSSRDERSSATRSIASHGRRICMGSLPRTNRPILLTSSSRPRSISV